MRNLIILSLLTALSFVTKAQNLVPNGNFESYNSCPNYISQVYRLTHWRSYTTATPDFYHVCGNSWGSNAGIPSNYAGYQYPHSNNSYAGVLTYVQGSNYKEYIATSIMPMQVGRSYEISMSVSRSDRCGYATNDLGVYLYDSAAYTVSGQQVLPITPQISFSSYGVLYDTLHWVRLSAIFVADSAYDNIVVGGFKDTVSMSLVYSQGSSTSSIHTTTAYYYIDSIVIKPINLITSPLTDTIYCNGDTIHAQYTVIDSNRLTTSNNIILQLSDPTGSFQTPLNIASINTRKSGTISGVIPNTINPGLNYRVRITSTNQIDSSNPNFENITIGKYPNKPDASSNSPVCSGDTLRLNATTTTTGNVTYLWMGPNSLVSTSQNTNIPNATVSNSGSYIVTAAIYGCSTKDTIVAAVNPSPIAITATATTPVCVADTLRLFSTNSTTGAAYSWVGPNSFTSSGQNPYIANTTMAAAGDYIATASLSNGCTRKDTVTVQVRPLPANFNAVAGNICEGNTFFLAGNTSSAGVSFSWTGPNGFTSTLQNPNISPATTAATGNYYVTGTLNGCSIKDTVYGSVYPIPARPLPIANTPVCVGQDLKLNVSNPQSGAYSWTGIGGYSAAVTNPVRASATTAMAGKYYVTVTANGCTSDKDSVTVVVNPAPVINMYPSPKDSICQGATLTFISSTANAGTSYQRYWYRNNTVIGGASNANYSTTTAADNDEYYVTLVATGVCADPYTDTSNKITMRVFPWLPASVSITANPSTTVPSGTMINFTATPVNGGNKPTYQWTRNGAPVVGALSNIWGASTLSHNDEICLNMSSSYLCPNPKTAKSNCIRVSIETTGINGIAGNSNIKVYPNPVRDILNINGVKAGNNIMLYDISGRLLLQQTALANQATINIASVAAGVYQLVIADISTVTRFKITKE
ncbi:MAG: T9SS type A sorting domain-containing protein [Chitinophagales bacterium]|nr:T9SS type A sorting domain-containing protein [Chitinophagales bacterium]